MIDPYTVIGVFAAAIVGTAIGNIIFYRHIKKHIYPLKIVKAKDKVKF
jgi:hypothetical protein